MRRAGCLDVRWPRGERNAAGSRVDAGKRRDRRNVELGQRLATPGEGDRPHSPRRSASLRRIVHADTGSGAERQRRSGERVSHRRRSARRNARRKHSASRLADTSGQKRRGNASRRRRRIEVDWRGVLRDGSEYVRQEFTIARSQATCRFAKSPYSISPLPERGCRNGARHANRRRRRVLRVRAPLANNAVDGDRVRCRMARTLPLRSGTALEGARSSA